MLKITLVKEKEIISEDSEVAETLNTFFKDVVKSLDLQIPVDLLNTVDMETYDPIDSIIKKFQFHPSILKIKEKVKPVIFKFSEVELGEIEKQIGKLNPRKATTSNNIPTKLLKENSDICSTVLHKLINTSITSGTFPDQLKIADISPVFKKDDATNAKNYRPISVLPSVSKVYERLIQNQLMEHLNKYLSPFLCGYRKGYSTQHALTSLIEKWRCMLDKKGFAGAMLMDLSKAFDTIDHNLLIAKLNAYGFSKSALRLIKSYLTNRWQRTKINTSFSSWTELLLGVPQGSVLGPILFNIYLNDLFWFNEETNSCNYADDTTFYACDISLNTVIQRLEHDSLLALEWFECNHMKLNEDKCHLLIAGHKYEHIWANFGSVKIWESDCVKLLGINIDRELSFNYHISNLCMKAGRKISALARVSRLMSLDQRRLLLKSFIESQFAYSPLVWMFHDRCMNNKINKLHERSLRIVYRDDISTFEELLLKDGSLSTHHRNIHALAIEMYKSVNSIAPDITQDLFIKRENKGIKLRSQNEFILPKANTVHYGHDSLKYFDCKVWNMIPNEIKFCSSIDTFKLAIKKWTPSECSCRLCKLYITGIGYI